MNYITGEQIFMPEYSKSAFNPFPADEITKPSFFKARQNSVSSLKLCYLMVNI